ncbi:MAG: hypothetical protein Q4D88_01375 [Anaerococcus sp.]|nr:hypothetical protein [Anaerococcus sp.]
MAKDFKSLIDESINGKKIESFEVCAIDDDYYKYVVNVLDLYVMKDFSKEFEKVIKYWDKEETERKCLSLEFNLEHFYSND